MSFHFGWWSWNISTCSTSRAIPIAVSSGEPNLFQGCPGMKLCILSIMVSTVNLEANDHTWDSIPSIGESCSSFFLGIIYHNDVLHCWERLKPATRILHTVVICSWHHEFSWIFNFQPQRNINDGLSCSTTEDSLHESEYLSGHRAPLSIHWLIIMFPHFHEASVVETTMATIQLI